MPSGDAETCPEFLRDFLKNRIIRELQMIVKNVPDTNRCAGFCGTEMVYRI